MKEEYLIYRSQFFIATIYEWKPALSDDPEEHYYSSAKFYVDGINSYDMFDTFFM